METEKLQVKNVKCGGCATRIQQGLTNLNGVEAVEVDVATGAVTVAGDAFSRDDVVNTLSSLGYPLA